MKRRAFLAAGIFPFLSTPLLAAPKTGAARKAATKPKPRAKAKGKAGKKAAESGRSSAPPAANPRTTAQRSVLDAAHPGSSATRLPPVRPQELPGNWQRRSITFQVAPGPSRGRQRLWLPLPMNQDTLYQRSLGVYWQGNAERGAIVRLPEGDLEAFYGEWPAGVAPQLALTVIAETSNRRFDVSRRSEPPEREDLVRRFLSASRQLPNEGRVYALALEIVGRVVDPVAQARVLYDWVIARADYNPDLPGGGHGDARALLENLPAPTPPGWRYQGGSADVAGLFTALCRAIGIPARRVFGFYAAPSQTRGSLGLANADATRAAHCRAEFYIPGYRWIGVDPAGVCRAVTMGGLEDGDAQRVAWQRLLFGVWEMNWLAWNISEDVRLPLPGDDNGPFLPFFCLPRLDRPEGELDGMNPETFGYRIEVS
ncbi:MAG: transglutaminase-like domain-containing protein [Zoogloeaceae bacterium]|jgi:transglutaminase-like putative cysteine protease|nr:transglutaminase-like domain-containing protein [Zoogloeaceae bacterium]